MNDCRIERTGKSARPATVSTYCQDGSEAVYTMPFYCSTGEEQSMCQEQGSRLDSSPKYPVLNRLRGSIAIRETGAPALKLRNIGDSTMMYRSGSRFLKASRITRRLQPTPRDPVLPRRPGSRRQTR